MLNVSVSSVNRAKTIMNNGTNKVINALKTVIRWTPGPAKNPFMGARAINVPEYAREANESGSYPFSYF
jgi:hypothetical protein